MTRAAAPDGRHDGIVLRDAVAADAGAIAGLLGELGYPCSVADVAARLAALDGQRNDRVRVATDASGAVLGLAHAGVRVSLETGTHAELLSLVVAAGAHGHGIGARLLADFEHWAGARNMPLWLRSRIERDAAHGFYQRRGWQRVKTQHVFRRDGDTTTEA